MCTDIVEEEYFDDYMYDVIKDDALLVESKEEAQSIINSYPWASRFIPKEYL